MTAAAPRLLYVFRYGWRERVRDVESGESPAEAHGFFALRRWGVDVDAVDSSLTTPWRWRAFSRLAQRTYYVPRSGLGYRLDQARAVRAYLRSDPDRWIVPTADSVALPLLAERRRGTLPNPIAYLSIGLCDAIHRGRVRTGLAQRYLELARAAAAVLVFTPVEVELFEKLAPGIDVRLIPLGIDVDWWGGHDGRVRANSVFSVGRDPARSFPTLAEAVADLPVETTIVGTLARHQGVRSDANLRVLDDVSYAELRRMLGEADVVVVPSRRAAYGAGQMTALQAMAAGKPVIMTDSGWAAPQGLRDREHFVAVPPEDPAALRDAIRELLASEDRGRSIGSGARQAVRERFSLERQARALLDALRTP